MPIIIDNQEIKVIKKGSGWKIHNLADAKNFGSPVMVVHRWVLEPKISGPVLTHSNVDQLLYVIRGSGTAKVNSIDMVLDEESVLWLENGDEYQFVSGESGLEILQGYSPEYERRND